MVRQLPLFSFIVIFLITLSSCAVNPVTGKQEIMFVSEAQEIKMGDDFYPSGLWGDLGGGGEYRDPALKGYLGGIIKSIHKVSHRPHLPVSFAIQNSSVPNAWAIPGHVVITRGLLAGLQSEAEFAFIMGHEMGHVSAKHSARQISKQMLQQAGLLATGLALSASGNERYTEAGLTAGAVGSSLPLLKYSRTDELEADRLGVEYMSRLGYDPKNAIDAHINLEKTANRYMKSAGGSSSERTFFQEMLSTHPRTSVRIAEIERISGGRTIKGDGTGRAAFIRKSKSLRKTDRIYWDYYDKSVRALKKKELNEARRLIDKAIAADRSEPPFFALKGFISLEEKKLKAARKSFSASLSLDPGYEPAIRGMAAYFYETKAYSSSISRLKRAIEIFPGDAAAHYLLGMDYYRLKDYREAVKYLGAYAGASPKDPKVHYYLGASYEALGELQNAYNEYLKQLKVAPNNEEGRSAARRVRALRSPR